MGEVVMSYASALREALKEEMRRDPSVIVLGEEVGVWGGVFTVTAGLLEEFGPQRVIDTPISEAAIIGLAIGASLAGLRPVAEIMYMDFLTIGLDQLVTHASKLRYMSGGKLRLPMVVRTQYGLGRGYGPQHTQFFASWFFQTPGLKVVLPSTPGDAKGLLKSAIRDDNPVLFIENALLYNVTGPVPEGEHLVPLGAADVKRKGSDVTIVAVSRALHDALKAAEILSESYKIEAEVIDPRTLVPMDLETIVSSVTKTGRVAIVSDDVRSGGIGAEIGMRIAEKAFYYLEAPIVRISAPDLPAPASYHLEQQYMVNEKKIVSEILEKIFGSKPGK